MTLGHAILLGSVTVCALCSLAASAPATQPAAESGPQVSDLRVAQCAGYSYVYLQQETSMSKMTDSIGELMPKLSKAMEDGTVVPSGPLVFFYEGMDGSDKPFTLKCGVAVRADAKAPAGFQLAKINSQLCATLLYSGPVSQMRLAYEKLFSQLGEKQLRPAGACAEVYLLWEGAESANNVIQVRMPIAATDAAAQ